jgi:AmmeMemoRadiSam system protein A
MTAFSGQRSAHHNVTHPFIDLAASAIQIFLTEHRVIAPPALLFRELPDALLPAGVFVCLKRAGQLRGCVGTIAPEHATRALEVVHNAIGAASRDPRFPPVRLEEMAGLSISVDVLSPCESVRARPELDPQRYGIVLVAGQRRSVLLPGIEGVATLDEQLALARTKAAVSADEPVELFRFEVTRYQ